MGAPLGRILRCAAAVGPAPGAVLMLAACSRRDLVCRCQRSRCLSRVLAASRSARRPSCARRGLQYGHCALPAIRRPIRRQRPGNIRGKRYTHLGQYQRNGKWGLLQPAVYGRAEPSGSGLPGLGRSRPRPGTFRFRLGGKQLLPVVTSGTDHSGLL